MMVMNDGDETTPQNFVDDNWEITTAGAAEWDPKFFEEHNTTIQHADYHFKPEADKDLVTGISWNRTTWQMTFNEANISQMSVLVTGNSSVQTEAYDCMPEGCPAEPEEWCANGCGTRHFRWSCGMQDGNGPCWNVTGDASVDIPSTLWVGTIWGDWTVILDTSTPVLHRLTVRGRLIFMPDAGEVLEMRAHYVRVRFGQFIMGNETDPIQPGTTAKLTLHGDKYVKVDYDGNTRYNNKEILINGNFSAHGAPVTSWLRLGQNARPGDHVIRLEAPGASGWRPGDEILLRAFNGNEYHTVRNISTNGSVVTLVGTISNDHIGTCVNLTNGSRIFSDVEMIDMRTAVALLTRNVIISGGDTNLYDRISGTTSYMQAYGAYVTTLYQWTNWLPGWDSTMAGAWQHGRETYPPGVMNFAYPQFHRIGRGSSRSLGASTALRFHGDSEGPQSSVTIRGCTEKDPYTGGALMTFSSGPLFSKVEQSRLAFVDNVFYGSHFHFFPSGGGRHIVRHNMIIGGGANGECTGVCPPTGMVLLGGGSLVVKDNLFIGHKTGVHMFGGCGFTWQNNIAMGNKVGFDVRGCTSHPLLAYKNTAGVISGMGLTQISNFLSVDCQIGFMGAGSMAFGPSDNTPYIFKVISGIQRVHHATIIGRLGGTNDGFDFDCRPLPYGSIMVGDEGLYFSLNGLGYSGIQMGGLHAFGMGYADHNTQYVYRVDHVAFQNFSGVDKCGLTNAAFTNQARCVVTYRPRNAVIVVCFDK